MDNKQITVLLVADNNGSHIIVDSVPNKIDDYLTVLEQTADYNTALQNMSDNQHCVYFIDRVDGLKLLHNAVEAGCISPVVFLADDDSLYDEAMQNGAVDYLLKKDVDSRLLSRLFRYVIRYKLLEERTEKRIKSTTALLERQMAERVWELSALYEIVAAASEYKDLQETLFQCLYRVLAVTGNRMGAIHVMTESENILELAVQRNLPAEIIAQIKFLPSDDGLAGMVIKNGDPLIIPDVNKKFNLAKIAPVSCPYLGTQMKARGRVMGLISIFGEAGQKFSIEEVTLLSSISAHVGVAVENEQLSRRAEQAAVIQERERLSREIHDSMTQSLYSLNLFAEIGRETAELGDLEAVKQYFIQMGETTQHVLKEMRILVYELRPLDLENDGLVGALRQRLDAVEKRANIKSKLVVEQLVELPADIEKNIYRIAQEALNNALKHSKASSVTVYLRTEGEYVELEIVDDGRGFYPDATAGMGGMGLMNMRHRAERLHSSLTIDSKLGEGTQIKVKVKIE